MFPFQSWPGLCGMMAAVPVTDSPGRDESVAILITGPFGPATNTAADHGPAMNTTADPHRPAANLRLHDGGCHPCHPSVWNGRAMQGSQPVNSLLMVQMRQKVAHHHCSRSYPAMPTPGPRDARRPLKWQRLSHWSNPRLCRRTFTQRRGETLHMQVF